MKSAYTFGFACHVSIDNEILEAQITEEDTFRNVK